jgi:hypothetical protein
MKKIIVVGLMLLFCSSVYAKPNITEVVAVGPAWDTFTNRDGTGLYHEILNKLFGLYGITVKRIYAPSGRAYDLVRNGKADFMTCHDVVKAPLRLAKYPMFEGTFFVFYKKSRIGEWQGDETLKGKTVAWRIGYYEKGNFPVDIIPKEVKSGVSALGMVLLDRVDFYVDDMAFIKNSLAKSSIPFDINEYEIKPVGRRTYHPVFSTSERADEVMRLYDEGMEKLYRSGELPKIFKKWGYSVPHYEME